MTKRQGEAMLAKDLRLQAENVVRLSRRDIATLTDQDEIQRLVHELQVHQIELEMQNESLHHAQIKADAAREQYQDLFDAAPVGYLLLDALGSIVRINAAGLALLQAPSLLTVSQLLSAFIVPQDWPVLQEKLRHVAEFGSATCEVRLIAPNKTVLHVRADISPASGDLGTCLVVLTNIEERKRYQDALEQANRELEFRVAARTAELAARNRELEAESAARLRSDNERSKLEARLRESERFESLGLLAAGVAHDFNNLLVSVVANADLLLLTPGIPEIWRESLALIKREGHNASELTHQLLVFAGQGELQLTALAVPEVVSASVALLQGNLREGIELTTDMADDLPAIEADMRRVQQVLMNLVSNAAEAIAGTGRISLRARAQVLDETELKLFRHRRGAEPGHFVILEVADSGSGMNPATLIRMFDPFFSTKFTGRGLGLASVLGIVQSHRGALRVHTRAGAGTRFEVALRCTKQPASRRAVTAPANPAWKGSGPLLLIDDDESVRRALGALLTSLGFDVTAADGGRQGLELYLRQDPPFRAVVLDWLMPGMSGEQVLQELRALQTTLPVLLVSGYSSQEFATDDAYLQRLQKPMSLEQLREALRTVLGDAPRVAAAP